MKERLQKILAKAGVSSRRGAEELIRSGKVTIDGKVVTEMGLKIDPTSHLIKVNNKQINSSEEKLYILLNKPAGYVTTMHDPQGRPIVTTLLKGFDARLFPVGRLDLDTEGALLLTNDGDLAHQILHPKFNINKTYVARVKGCPAPAALKQLARGIMIDQRLTSPARLRVLKKSSRESIIEIIIHEGRKRQVRKMFAAINHPVIHLQRTAYGNLKLGKLPLGKFRTLSRTDLKAIFN